MSRLNPLWLLPAFIILAGSLGTEKVSHGATGIVEAFVFGALAAGALIAAAWWPRAAVVASGVFVFGYFAVGLTNGPIFLALPLTLLMAGRQSPRRELAPYAATGVVLGVAGVLVRAGVHHFGWPEGFWQCVGLGALSVVGAVVGWSLRDRASRHVEHAQLVATEERLRMARDLHDGVGHGLAVIAMHAGVALHLTDRQEQPDEAIRQSLLAIRDASRDSLDALRSELGRLAPGEAGAERTPERGLADLDVLLARVRSGGLDVEVHRDDLATVPGEAGAAAYAIVQEALTNVLRHSGASRVRVWLAIEGERLVVAVEDDGHVSTGPVVEGMGLRGMRARVERLGGTLGAGPRERGFVVRADLPLGGVR